MYEIVTERLLMRRFMADDWKDLYEYLSDEKVVKYEPYNVFTEVDCKQEAIKRSNNEAYWAICLKNNNKLVGNIYFEKQDFQTWRLLERLKMRREGVLKKNIYFKTDEDNNPIWADTYEYAILSDEWSFLD